MSVGEADLDKVFLATRLGDGCVVELLDDLVTDVASLEAMNGQR
jgi:hypothetical protein